MTGRRARILLGASMFVMGACGIAYEYVLSVLGNYLMGSSHEEIFIIIGIMMFAMGVGSVLQRRLRAHLFDYFLLLEVLLGLLGGFAGSLVYSFFAVSESYRVVLYGFCFVIGALIGMEIPIVIRLNKAYSSSLRTNLADILSMDYVGSLVGAFLFAYVLLIYLSLTRIGFVLGIANVLIACVGFVAFRRVLRRPLGVGAAILAALVLLVFGLISAPDWAAWAEQRYFQDPIVYRATTRYQHVVLTERNDRVRLYLNGHLQFSSVDEAIYHEFLVHPAMTLSRSHRRVLILGGGDGLALREVLQYPDVETVTLVDIDSVVTELAATHPSLVGLNGGALGDPRVTVRDSPGVRAGAAAEVSLPSRRPPQKLSGGLHPVAEVRVANLDADVFLRGTEGPFDVAFLDFPDPSTLELAKLYSREFYSQLRKRITPDALIAVQSASPFHARLVFLCIGETLRASGYSATPYHHNVPSFGEWGWHLATPRAASEATLRRGLKEQKPIPVATRYLTPELIAASTVFGKGWLTDPADVRPHTRLEPVLVRYHREAWRGY